MAYIYQRERFEKGTAGEQSISKSLSVLSDDWFIYSQYTLNLPSELVRPDFVLINRDFGLYILEVKDWLYIEKIVGDYAYVRILANGEITRQTSPVKQALDACQKLTKFLVKHPELTISNGKLSFPWMHAGLLPKMSNSDMKDIRKKWGFNNVFGGSEVDKHSIESSLLSISRRFESKMTSRQFDILRGIIDPDLQLPGKGILDVEQESIAKEDFGYEKNKSRDPYRLQLPYNHIARIEAESGPVPNEIRKLSESQSVRLVRGFAGTGKTDVLIRRCCNLKKKEPEKRILVTTFNKSLADKRLLPAIKPLNPTVELKRIGQICQEIYELYTETTIKPQNIKGIITKIVTQDSSFKELVEKYGIDFLEEEIQWIKETDLIDESNYINSLRQGRGGSSGITLSRKQKTDIHKLFRKYQEKLAEMRIFDWPDFYNYGQKLLKENAVQYPKYDEILVDEAQHLAPKWVEMILLLLKPEGRLFLCEDPSQSVYRSYSWKQKGIIVSGRTKWLRIPYRSTREILEVACALIEGNNVVRRLLEDFDILENLDLSFARHGQVPELHIFNSWSDERDFVRAEINRLVQSGYLAEEIAVLHTQNYVIKEFHDLLRQGVYVNEVREETGMEYKIVFIPNLNAFFTKRYDDESYEIERNRAKLYTAISRTIDVVYLSHNSKQPKEIKPILSKVKIKEHHFN